jgi:sugar phosphate permease
VRWQLVLLMMGYSFLTWFNRKSISVAANLRIMDEYGIAPEVMGTVYSAMLTSYTLCMIPGGWLTDRWGARRALALMGLGSGLFVVLTGVAGLGFLGGALVLPSFLVIRALMGVFTAPVYTGCGRTVTRWLPFDQRALANGLIIGAAPFGIAATSLVIPPLIGLGEGAGLNGWRFAFFLTGAVTILVSLLWTFYATDYPAQHARVNRAERDWIGVPPPAPAGKQPEGAALPGWLLLLRNRSLVLLALSYASVNYFEYLFFFWLDFYFLKVLHLSVEESSFYASLPPLAKRLGNIAGGWVADRLMRVIGYRGARMAVPVVGMTSAAVLLFLGANAHEPAWIVTWLSLALGACGAVESPFWTTAFDVGGRHGATAAAIVNTSGNAGGLVAPVVTPLVGAYWGWYPALVVGSLVCLTGVVFWLWINPADRVEDEAPA